MEQLLETGKYQTQSLSDLFTDEVLYIGKVRSIGVSNFSIKTLEMLLPHCKVIPAVNQVEMHPCLPQIQLKEFCDAKGISLTAYSPFGTLHIVRHLTVCCCRLTYLAGRGNRLLMDDTDFISIAKAHDATVAQIAVAWALQRDTVVIPKSVNPERMKNNITVRRLIYRYLWLSWAYSRYCRSCISRQRK